MRVHHVNTMRKGAGVVVVGGIVLSAFWPLTNPVDARAIPVTQEFDAVWAAIDAGSLTTMHRAMPNVSPETLWAVVDAGSLGVVDRVGPVDPVWAVVDAGSFDNGTRSDVTETPTAGE